MVPHKRYQRTMTRSREYTAVLLSHPETCSPAARGITAQVRWTEAAALAVHYALDGDIARLRIPPLRSPRRADHLWQHTCFEAFVSAPGRPEYWEFNFSPSGEWAVYRFRKYRDPAPLDDAELAPHIAAYRADDHLDLHATICLNRLPINPHREYLCLGLSAVIEDENGALCYWALRHPADQPDFHHADSFSLEIARPALEMIKP